MKRTIVAIILALGLLLIPTGVSADAGVTVENRTGDGEWADNTWEVSMFPGEVKATTLTLYNSSSNSLDVEVTIMPDSLDNGNLTFELDKSAFAMPGKSRADVTLTVSANGSATPGIYTTELTIKSEIPPAPTYVSGGGGGGGGGSKDRSPPRIYSISVPNIAETTADICWTTNEASTSQVEYWASPSKFSPLDETYKTNHLVHLTDLTPKTTYYYKTMSEDESGNLRVSEEYSFTTLEEVVEPAPPKPEEPKPVPEPEPKPEPKPEPEPLEPPMLPPVVTPPEVEPAGINWWLVLGIICSGLAAIYVIFLMRRRRKSQ